MVIFAIPEIHSEFLPLHLKNDSYEKSALFNGSERQNEKRERETITFFSRFVTSFVCETSAEKRISP